MTSHLDPLAATAAIEDAYRRYLLTTMRTNDPAINLAVRAGFKSMQRPLVNGPIVEASPPYARGRTVREMVAAGILSDRWLSRDFGGQIVADRPLYLHQDQAIARAAELRRNLVVATGTGSGKTESFLIPIVDRLFRQAESGVLSPGVRALLVYPMNALANDQLKRLRLLLRDSPEITFGRYTGETPNDRPAGVQALRAAVPDAEVLPNELLGRNEFQEAPPHILLTNYAMLEYLLLRPADSPLFDSTEEHGWRFLVLDEVHSYDGAMGLEIGMLLRRLRDRVQRGAGQIQAFATSATIGRREDCEAVARFAEDLFGLPFSWHESDPASQDVVTASREEAISIGIEPVRCDIRAVIDCDDETKAATALAADPRVRELLQNLAEGPLALDAVANIVSDSSDLSLAADLLRCLSKLQAPSKNIPFMRARFHTFVRATEGVDVCLRVHADGGPRAFLEPQKHCPECGDSAPIAELTTCRRCEHWHLRGVIRGDSLERATDREDSDELVRYVGLRIGSGINEDDDDDDDDLPAPLFVPSSRPEEATVLCFRCLRVGAPPPCGCPSENKREVVIASRSKSGSVRCVNCNASASQRGPRRLRLGRDAPPAVIASSLFDELPRESGERPRFLSFADSRQDAAFFAPYLERTYDRVARRRLLAKAFQTEWTNSSSEEGLPIGSLAPRVRKLGSDEGFFPPSAGPRQQEDIAKAWIIAELTSMDSRQSLAGVGLCERRLVRPENWIAPASLLDSPWNLTPDEAWTLVETLLRSFLDSQAVNLPIGVSPGDVVFSPRNKEFAFRESGAESNAELTILGWRPTSGSNTRSDYLDRLLQQLQPEWTAAERQAATQQALSGLWQFVTNSQGPLAGYLVSAHHQRLGMYFQLDCAYWEFAPTRTFLQCSNCRALYARSVRGNCATFRCRGSLSTIERPPADDHYLALYQSSPRGLLVSEEHTAQWSPEEAARVQGRFTGKDGDINVLSCSTTFELGVDVGELEAVLLRNVPPSAANYVQRAGRAGRRSSSVGFIVTYAQLRPHDINSFDNARSLVSGNVPAPRIPARNARIVRRHLHSVAIARFFRKTVNGGEPWPRTVSDFFEGDPGSSPCDRFREYLRVRDPELLGELARITHPDLHDELGIANWGWAEELASDDVHVSALARAEAETKSDIDLYSALIEDAASTRDARALARYQAVLNTVKSGGLIQILATRNVLPKYGFPVDVVSLRTSHLTLREARSVALDRDLRIAVSEFAPGSGVVAAKRLWVSEGLHLLPNRGLPDREYAVCQACNRFYAQENLGNCSQCGESINARTMVEPVFGFVARDPDVKPLGEDRPQRLFGTRVLFHEFGDVGPREPLLLDPQGQALVVGRFSRQGSLAVVNGARGRGFLLCHQCGFARVGGSKSRSHRHPSTARNCTGALVRVDLGHTFTSDIVEFAFPGLYQRTLEFRASVRSAILEGARRTLGVGEGDLDSVAYIEHGQPIVALFDDVPGGAGLARETFQRFREVLETSYFLCRQCSCGENSSCYGCLRSFSNQHEHEILNRSAVAQALEALLAAV